MYLLLAAVLFIAELTVLLSVQAATSVPLRLLALRLDSPLSVLLFLPFLLGAGAVLLLSLRQHAKMRALLEEKERTIKELQDNLVEYRNLLNPTEQVN